MFKKMFKKENLVKLEIQESGNVVLSKALTKLADDFLEGMTKCKDKEIMSNLSCTREKLVNLAQYADSNKKKHFECEKESLDLIIESLKEYKESISTTIKKGSTNNIPNTIVTLIQYDLFLSFLYFSILFMSIVSPTL